MDERKRIGDLLRDAGIVTEAQLEAALAEQRRSGGRLCYNLIRLGHLRADDLVGFLRDQFGVAAVNLERYQVPEEVLRLLPSSFARERRIVPLHVLGPTLTVAMVDPSRADDIAAVREITGLEPEPVITPEAALEAALERFYPTAPGAGGAEGALLDLGDEARARALLAPTPAGGLDAEDWLRRALLMAVRRRTREIHLEPLEEGLRVRYRVRGELQDGDLIPAEVRDRVTRRARSLAGAGARGGSLPAEGRFRLNIRGRRLRATLSAMPTLHGERIVVKILDESLLAREFQELGMSKEVADETQRLLMSRTGLVLLCAPPGQGKTTTFYSFLTFLRGEGGRNVMTLECPVRFPLAGVSQTQVGGDTGLDFGSGMQAALHQEPDVIGLAELPNTEALEMALATSRRCLVVARSPLRDCEQALAWLREVGASPGTLGLLLRGILAQRVLPKLCTACREPLAETVPLLEGVRDARIEELSFYAADGCGQCGSTGRVGRVAVFELLSFRGELRDKLLRGEPGRVIVDAAQRLGMWTLREDGVLKASRGLLDVRELLEAMGSEEPAAG